LLTARFARWGPARDVDRVLGGNVDEMFDRQKS